MGADLAGDNVITNFSLAPGTLYYRLRLHVVREGPSLSCQMFVILVWISYKAKPTTTITEP